MHVSNFVLTAGIECNNRKEQKKPKLAFYDFARLDCLGSNPHSLDLTTRQLDPNPLQVGLEPSLVDFDELQANAAGFFLTPLCMIRPPTRGLFPVIT